MAQAGISDVIILHKDIAKGVFPILIAGATETKNLTEILVCIRNIQLTVRAKSMPSEFTEFDSREETSSIEHLADLFPIGGKGMDAIQIAASIPAMKSQIPRAFHKMRPACIDFRRFLANEYMAGQTQREEQHQHHERD